MRKKSYGVIVRGVRTVGGSYMYEIDELDRKGYVDAHLYALNAHAALADLVPQGLFFSGGSAGSLLRRSGT
jgi:hypothetical protein